MSEKKTLIFDWGDTIMRDFAMEGPMWKWDNVEWISDLEDQLQQLYKEYIMVVATSADHSGTEDMIKALERIGAHKYFDHFFSQKELGFKKPDPNFFLSIINKLNLNPSTSLMIGNSYEKDIAGAKKAGLNTLFFNEMALPGDHAAADRIIYTMKDLKKSIEEIL